MQRVIGGVLCVWLALTCAGLGVEGKAAPDAPPPGFSKEQLRKELLELERRVQQHFREKDYTQAERDCRRMIELAPKLAVAHYNLACALARQDKKDEALKALQESVALGMDDAAHFKVDEDLATLSQDPRFAAAVKQAEENERKALAAEKGADIAGVRTIENEVEGGLRYRLRISPAARKEKPQRLIAWLHPSGGSMNNVVENLAPRLNEHGYALLVFTRKQFAGWSEAEIPKLERTLQALAKIDGLDVRRPLLLGQGQGHTWLFGKDQTQRLMAWLDDVAAGKLPATTVGKPPEAQEAVNRPALGVRPDGRTAVQVGPGAAAEKAGPKAGDLLEYVAGQPSDIAPFAYAYRKGAANNPIETRWLNPTPDMLCGLLWEERRALRRIEVEFPSPPATVPGVQQLSLVTRTAAAPFEEASVPGFGLGPQQEFTLKPVGEPVATPQGKTVFTFASQNDVNSVKVHYSGSDSKVGVPVVRAYGRASWKKPVTVEIQWGFQLGTAGRRWDGRVEAYNGHVGPVSPLEKGCGVVATGEHAWTDGQGTTARRGIRLPVISTTGDVNSRTIVTLWTSGGDVSFTPGDLDSGPILIPGVGIYVATAESGLRAEQFQAQLAAKRLRTVRQQAREEPEASWASAMKRYHGKNALPDFPKPPYEPAMQIDVPEKQLVAQWRLGDWHLNRWSQKVQDDTYCVSIWEPLKAVAAGAEMGYTAIGLESSTNIRALDLMGSADVARGGLNWWLFFVKHATPWGKLADLGDGPLTAPGHSLKRMDSHYDQHHGGGHGRVLETCALHYLLTGDAAWLDKASPVLAKACDWTIQERKLWNRDIPPGAWCYGLQPPVDVCDGSDIRLFFSLNAWYYAGLRRAAEVLAGQNPVQYARFVSEAELFRQDIRKTADRSMALSPVVKVKDGTYRRYVPFAPYMRGLGTEIDTGFSGYADGHWFECIMGGLLLVRSGIYDVHEPVVQEMLDVYEDRLVQDGQNGQNGYNDAPALHLLLDDVPFFLRGMYNSYAAEVDPDLGYIFWETEQRWQAPGRQFARDKTFEEAAFLERVRAMLVMEDGKCLWLARAIPRAWLEQGKRIAVKGAPTFFGTAGYEIVSDVKHGKIDATVVMPSRRPPESVVLRFRHPKALPIRSVTVNGNDWKHFNKEQETIELKGLAGTVAVTANY